MKTNHQVLPTTANVKGVCPFSGNKLCRLHLVRNLPLLHILRDFDRTDGSDLIEGIHCGEGGASCQLDLLRDCKGCLPGALGAHSWSNNTHFSTFHFSAAGHEDTLKDKGWIVSIKLPEPAVASRLLNAQLETLPPRPNIRLNSHLIPVCNSYCCPFMTVVVFHRGFFCFPLPSSLSF